ncbi:MAG: hypothetical protein ACLQNV_00075 [Steroidobacteraceae bacterium]
MKTTNPVDAARIELLLADLRLPAIKSMWAKVQKRRFPRAGGKNAISSTWKPSQTRSNT